MTDDVQTTYDQVPYASHPYDRSHPDHMATIATLFGLDTPVVDQCRVLELGCAGGGNLIPQALMLPNSQFVGVDLSRVQIEEGQGEIAALGLENIDLQHRSILDMTPDDGRFDYIICHGVFSWVPVEVREKILQICSENLSANGVAYISYNTNPGWFLRGMVRKMLCFHAKQFEDPTAQVQQARALLDFLIDAGPAGDPTYHALLCRELEILRGRADSYLFHEHLEEDNEPVFFHEFNERAEAHGLRYLAEVQFSEMVPGNFSKTAEATLRELGVGLIHSEQYLDFLRNRTFRRTLLCRQEVELRRELDAKQLMRTYVTTKLRPESDSIDVSAMRDERFVCPSGTVVTVAQPLAKAALMQLGARSPEPAPFPSLGVLAHEALGHSSIRSAENIERENHELGALVLELYAADLVELRVSPIRYKTQVEDKPKASPLARRQVERGRYVTNLRHETVELTDLQAHLVRTADGQRNLEQLCDELAELVREGKLVVERYDQEISEDTMRTVLMEMLNVDLNNLVSAGLLM